jgi:hypothetical protein
VPVTVVDRSRRRTARPAEALGRLLGLPLAALARRRAGKPMHPDGVARTGMLERAGSVPPWGVPWLDLAARDPVVVRLSRGVGLPRRLPDLLGLAVRLTGPAGEPVDLLLTSTASGRLGRGVPALRRDPATTYGSIMGYRTDAGTVRLAATGERTADGSLAFVLSAARGGRPLRSFARLSLGEAFEPPDPDVRFDAVLHPPPGLVADGPIARLRAPAYAMARAGRSPDGGGGG